MSEPIDIKKALEARLIERLEREQLQRGGELARQLAAEPMSQEEARDRLVHKFFSETGIPHGLKKGWAVYEQRRKARAQVGAALPPGGCLTLGRESVLAGLLAETHMRLAQQLRLPTQAIRMEADRTGGGVRPVAKIDPPADWVIPVVKTEGVEPKEIAKAYVEQVLADISPWFQGELTARLKACGSYRPELRQEVRKMGERCGKD